MIYNLVLILISKYAIVIYEIIAAVILLLITMKKKKKVKTLEQEAQRKIEKNKNDVLDNILKNQKRGI